MERYFDFCYGRSALLLTKHWLNCLYENTTESSLKSPLILSRHIAEDI